MKLQMFGSRDQKSKSDLKKVTIPTGSESPSEDIWSLGEQDALHVPILGSGAKEAEDTEGYNPNLLNPFGVYVSEEAKKEASNKPLLEAELEDDSIPLLEEAVIEAAAEEILASEVLIETQEVAEELPASTEPSIPVASVEEDHPHIIGLYASSELYVKSLEKELSLYDEADIHCFDSSMNEAQLKDDSEINMWIVNLSDDDEGPLLDSIIEISADHPTLYLSGSLSKHCKNSIQSFLKEH